MNSEHQNNNVKQHTILIIDDDKDFLEPLSFRLESKGFRVITADDGYSGYETAKELKPDLILSDVMMPSVDGFHISRLLKNDRTLDHIPIILMSGLKKTEADKILGLESCAANAYLFKPFDDEELIETINNLIKKNQL